MNIFCKLFWHDEVIHLMTDDDVRWTITKFRGDGMPEDEFIPNLLARLDSATSARKVCTRCGVVTKEWGT